MSTIKLLYVDDEEESLTIVKIGLESRGYSVITAKSGEEGLRFLQTETPDLIIADLRMEPMNGFEFFQEVKKIPRFLSTPVFFLTALDDFLTEKYSHTLGVDAYITKPVDLNSLDTFIRRKVTGE